MRQAACIVAVAMLFTAAACGKTKKSHSFILNGPISAPSKERIQDLVGSRGTVGDVMQWPNRDYDSFRVWISVPDGTDLAQLARDLEAIEGVESVKLYN